MPARRRSGEGDNVWYTDGRVERQKQQCWLDPSEASMADPSVADLPGLTGQTPGQVEVNDT